MKRWIHSATEVKTYRNKKNPNKYVEVHEDGHGHRSAKQYMKWKEAGVKNPTGDGNLHRWRKGNMDDLLEDYEEVEVENCDQVSASDDADMNLANNALSARVGDEVYDKLKDRIGVVVKEGQSGNYGLIYVDFKDGSKVLKINPMDDAQRKGRFFKVID